MAAKALRSSAVCGKLYCWRSHTHATNYYEVVGARNQLNLSTNYYEVVGARNQLNLSTNYYEVVGARNQLNLFVNSS